MYKIENIPNNNINNEKGGTHIRFYRNYLHGFLYQLVFHYINIIAINASSRRKIAQIRASSAVGFTIMSPTKKCRQ